MTRTWIWRWPCLGNASMRLTESGKEARWQRESTFPLCLFASLPPPCHLATLPPRPARSRPEADLGATPLLLPRDVPPPGDQRPFRRGVVSRRDRADLLDARLALAAEAGNHRSGPAYRRPGVRLPARLVPRWAAGGIHLLPQRRAGTLAAGSGGGDLEGAGGQRRGQSRSPLVSRRQPDRLRLHRPRRPLARIHDLPPCLLATLPPRTAHRRYLDGAPPSLLLQPLRPLSLSRLVP